MTNASTRHQFQRSLYRCAPNAPLVDQPGSRIALHTPALVLDLDILDKNIALMAKRAAAYGVALRPHAKTHKSAEIAKRQLAAGAIGVCVAKLGEAEALIQKGIDRILITSPIVTATKMELLMQLALRADLMVVVDDAGIADRLDAVAAASSVRMKVLIDLGMGPMRTGAATPEAAAALAVQVSKSKSLEYCGLQAYAGQIQHIEDLAEREVAAQAQRDRIATTVEAMKAAGCAPKIITGGGTGSHDMDAKSGLFTELQVGSYVFMDVEYLRVNQFDSDHAGFRTSLHVQTTVISANVPGRATTDAGLKAFAMDGPRPEVGAGAPKGSKYEFMGDEQGCVVFPEGERGVGLGAVLQMITPHCDPTVNLYDVYHCVRGDKLVDLWDVDTRGASW